MVTGLYAGILALFYVALSAHVISKRKMHRVSLGDGANPVLTRAIRVHGNFAEYAPFTLLLMGFYEIQAGSIFAIHAFGIALLASRILHFIGLQKDVMLARIAGTAATLTTFVVLGLLLIFKAI